MYNMNEKRIYVKASIGDQQYIGHMTKREANWKFDSFEEISKSEYRASRAEGTPSWGEYETQCKREGQKPQKRSFVTW